ncbi:hypothetical protein ABZ806_32425 [Spirillospora sp. NPDC047418]
MRPDAQPDRIRRPGDAIRFAGSVVGPSAVMPAVTLRNSFERPAGSGTAANAARSFAVGVRG